MANEPVLRRREPNEVITGRQVSFDGFAVNSNSFRQKNRDKHVNLLKRYMQESGVKGNYRWYVLVKHNKIVDASDVFKTKDLLSDDFDQKTLPKNYVLIHKSELESLIGLDWYEVFWNRQHNEPTWRPYMMKAIKEARPSKPPKTK